jgi:hypothetical protein
MGKCPSFPPILKKGRVAIVVEVEEANGGPTQVCGKFLTAALSSHFIHDCQGTKPIPIGDAALFVQVLGTSKLKQPGTAMISKWLNLEKSIRALLSLKGSHVGSYKLFYGGPLDFAPSSAKGKGFARMVAAFLAKF